MTCTKCAAAPAALGDDAIESDLWAPDWDLLPPMCQSCQRKFRRWFRSSPRVAALMNEFDDTFNLITTVEQKHGVILEWLDVRLNERLEEEVLRLYFGYTVLVERYVWFDRLADCAASAALAFAKRGWIDRNVRRPPLTHELIVELRRMDAEIRSTESELHHFRFIVRGEKWGESMGESVGPRFAHQNADPVRQFTHPGGGCSFLPIIGRPSTS